MRHAFDVYIHEKLYPIYDIEGKEHEGLNGEPKTYWLYFSKDLPEGVFPPIDSPDLIPYHVSMERLVWEIYFKQRTTTKEKWGYTNFNSHTSVEMKCNGRIIYEFGTSGGEKGLSFAMAKVQYMQVHLFEHSYNFLYPENEEGRKIWWYGLPATIQPRTNRGWEIVIIPDYTAGLSKTSWWKEYFKRREHLTSDPDDDMAEIEKEEDLEDMQQDRINWGDAFSDQHINWHRE